MWDVLIDWFGSRHWEPHGHCFLWTPSLLWTIVLSNLLIGLAYYSIPLTLLTLVRKRADLVHRPVFVLFAVFIFGCGTTHLVKLWTIWHPVYWLQGWADAVTAAASVLTAVVLWPLLPRVLAIPSHADLFTANDALAASNHQLQAALDDRQRLAEMLQTQNALLEKIFANTHFLLAYMNTDFDFVRVNQAYSHAEGQDPAYFEGKNHFALYPNAENEEIFRTVAATGEPYVAAAKPFIYPGRPDLTTYWDWSLQPVRDAFGKVEGLLLTLVDVTAGKQAEQAVQRQAAELARSNQELERFAYVASHDLRAPLRAIDNLATWIAEDEGEALSATARSYLAKLRGRVRRMETMVEDLLAYSRAGRILHEPVAVDTGALVRDVVEIVAPPPGFTVDVVDPMPVLTTERVPLETIFRNLIGNALKHHDRPEAGTITVTAARHGAWCEFVVADNGPGIDPEYHDRVFQLFQTLKPRDEVEGSGMGLAIVKKLVESRGGRIWLASASGTGAAFHFTWPAAPPTP
jgi:signal transduction histidine kinase